MMMSSSSRLLVASSSLARKRLVSSASSSLPLIHPGNQASHNDGMMTAKAAATFTSSSSVYFSSQAQEAVKNEFIVALPPNLKIDPRATSSPFYGLKKIQNISTETDDDDDINDNDDDNDDTLEEEEQILFDLSTKQQPFHAIPLPQRLHNIPIHHLQSSSVSGTIHLSPTTFGMDPIRTDILTRVVQYQRNKKRGKRTAKTKTISQVSGSGRKVRQQKGSGNARAGHSRPPHWRGGAKAHGPKGTIQDYTTKLNKQVRKMGLRHVLSQKLKEGNLFLVNDWLIHTYKTKDLAHLLLNNFGVGGRHGTTAFLIDAPPSLEKQEEEEEDNMYVGGVNVNLKVASGNLPKIKVCNQLGCNVYDVLKYEKLILSLDALKALEERLK